MRGLGSVAPALLWAALLPLSAKATPPQPAGAAARFPAACAQGAARQVRAGRELALAVLNAPPREVQRRVTRTQVCPLSADQRADLMLDAVLRNHVQVLKAVVRAGISPDQVVRADREGEWVAVTALNAAIALHAEPGLALALIELGADPNARSIDDDPPLFRAVAAQRLSVAKALLQAGARPDGRSVVLGATPLMAAVAQAGGRAASVDLATDLAAELLARGADINAASDFGLTPLMVAARLGNRHMVDWLLARGADPARLADDGSSYLVLLEQAGKPNSPAALALRLDTLNRATATDASTKRP